MIEIDMKKVGSRIRELRKDLELSQKQLSEKIGVSFNTLSQYEMGLSKTSIDVLANLAIELNTTTDYLLGLEH